MSKMPNPNALYPAGSGGYESGGDLADGGKMTLGFQHLDVRLAIGTDEPAQSAFATRHAILDIKPMCTEFLPPRDGASFLQATDKAVCAEDAFHARAIESSGDPVIRQLSSALIAAKCANGPHTGIYVDAVRLAIVARLLCLQSDAQPSPRYVNVETAEGQMRALQKWRLKRVLEHIDKHLADKISLSDLAAVAGLSRMHFAAQFRTAMNLRPHEYLLRRRIERAKELLHQSTMTIVEISLTVGFQTQAHFTTVFKRFVGDTPHRWRSRAGIHVSPSVIPQNGPRRREPLQVDQDPGRDGRHPAGSVRVAFPAP
jgi:AraC family transcriptional regulator